MQRIVPWLGKRIFKTAVWNYSRLKPNLYLTFDDGPHPTITPWILKELKKVPEKRNINATTSYSFFLIFLISFPP